MAFQKTDKRSIDNPRHIFIFVMENEQKFCIKFRGRISEGDSVNTAQNSNYSRSLFEKNRQGNITFSKHG